MRTTPRSRPCAAWSPPTNSAARRSRASTTTSPREPPASPWRFPSVASADEHGIVGVGADLEPGTLLAAYRAGLFPMPIERNGPLAWWSPDPRAVIPLEGLRVTRSWRQSCRHYAIRVDTAFGAVIDACADERRPHGWITPEIREAYVELHRLGWAHSVEAWTGDELAGGLYGVSIGGVFAGESMFHVRTDASKVALLALVERLRDDGRGGRGRLLDVQWRTDHLESLGAVEIARDRYLLLLREALALPLPTWDAGE